jgi:hypothetical protein
MRMKGFLMVDSVFIGIVKTLNRIIEKMLKGKELRARRYWIYVIIATIILLMLGWKFCARFAAAERQLLRAAPPTSGLMIGWPGASAFLEASDTLWTAPGMLPPALQRDLTLYRMLFQRLDSTGFSMERPLLFFLQMNGPEGPALGAIWAVRGEEAIRKVLPVTSVSRTQYQGRPVTTVELEGERRLTFTQYRDLLVMGRFPFLVEEVIGHLRGNPGAPLLNSTLASFAGASLTLWMNGQILNQNWTGSEAFWPEGWLRVGVDVEGDFQVLKGRFFAESRRYLSWMEGTVAARPGPVLNIIPEQFSYLEWRHYEAPAEGLGEGLLSSYFQPWAGGEQVYLTNTLGGTGGKEESFWVLSLSDRDGAAAALDSLAREEGMLEDYNYQTYRIRRLLTGSLRPGRGRVSFESPYCVLLDDYLLLSNSRSGLELWIDQFLAGATLVRSEAFLDFYQHNDQPARVWWLARPPLLNQPATGALLRDVFLRLVAGQPIIGGRWSGELATPALDATWKRETQAPAPGSLIAWRFRLEEDARTGPQLLRVGENTPPLFAVQDRGHRLYLLDASGREIWQKPLESPVRSAFHLIDYYQDGQQQLLFNTPAAIHLVDLEKGENVAFFPMVLQSPATNAMTVVDTSGHGGYAFFVANSNGYIYGFDREGRPLPGWNPRSTGAEVDHPLLHFQEATRDFFVALDTAGTLHVFKRDGTYRFPPFSFNDTFPNPPGYQLHRRASRIVACNKDGIVYVMNLAGDHFRLRLETRPRRPVKFAFADILGDDRNDYISLNRGRISVHYYRGNDFREAFTFRAEHPLTDVFAVEVPGRQKTAIGAVDASTGKIYLIDEKGDLFPGFPLAGRTRFAVIEPPAGTYPLLVVADGNTVYGYEVGY